MMYFRCVDVCKYMVTVFGGYQAGIICFSSFQMHWVK